MSSLRSFGCVMSSAEEGGESLGLLACVGELLAEESRMMTSAAAIDERGIGCCVGCAVTMGVWGSGCEGSTICGMETTGGGGWGGGCSVAEAGPKLAARAPVSKI